MLVSFEGLDGAGKSSLLREVAARLRSTLREPVLHLGDVSRSPTGRRLELFRADELSGEAIAGATAMSRCLAAAADLFYFDGALIAPMVSAGGVVLKERHVDSLISHEAPVLTGRYGWTEERAFVWLSSLVEPLLVRPSVTILVEAPVEHRERRLRERLQHARAELEPGQVDVDRAVFRMRASWYERLRLEDEARWVSIADPDGELSRASARASEEILARHRAAISRRSIEAAGLAE